MEQFNKAMVFFLTGFQYENVNIGLFIVSVFIGHIGIAIVIWLIKPDIENMKDKAGKKLGRSTRGGKK